MTVIDQAGFDARLEWGVEGARVLAGACRVVVVIDVLSSTTAIEVAVGRGAVVFPHGWPDPAEGSGEPQWGAPVDQAAAFARRVGAELAGGLAEPPASRFSLSPVSLLDIPAGTWLVLPSPNGSAVAAALAGAGAVVLAGCLRNASAVAAAAREAGGEGRWRWSPPASAGRTGRCGPPSRTCSAPARPARPRRAAVARGPPGQLRWPG